MELPASKAELLERVRTAHQQLETHVARLTPAQLAEPTVHDGWAVKDDLAHITWWEQHMLKLVQGALRGEKGTPLARPGEDIGAAVDRTNEEIFVSTRDRAPDEILAERQQSFVQIIAMIESLPEADVANPSRIDAVLGGSYLQMIAGDTYEHYEEHGKNIQDWLERTGPGKQQ